MDVHRPIHMLFHVVSCCFICLGNLIHSHVFLVVFRMNILLETHTHTHTHTRTHTHPINLQRAARFVSYISWFITSLMGGLIVIINAIVTLQLDQRGNAGNFGTK